MLKGMETVCEMRTLIEKGIRNACDEWKTKSGSVIVERVKSVPAVVAHQRRIHLRRV